MIGYISKYQKAINYADRQFPNASPQEKKRVVRQFFAKLVVGMATIGKVKGKLVVHKECVHQGINY